MSEENPNGEDRPPPSRHEYRQQVKAELQRCAGITDQQEVCRIIAGLFNVEYGGIFKDLKLEDLNALPRQPELVLRQVASERLDIDIDSLLVGACYVQLCDALAARYQQVANKLRELVATHGSLHLGQLEARISQNFFLLSVVISCPVIIL